MFSLSSSMNFRISIHPHFLFRIEDLFPSVRFFYRRGSVSCKVKTFEIYSSHSNWRLFGTKSLVHFLPSTRRSYLKHNGLQGRRSPLPRVTSLAATSCILEQLLAGSWRVWTSLGEGGCRKEGFVARRSQPGFAS